MEELLKEVKEIYPDATINRKFGMEHIQGNSHKWFCLEDNGDTMILNVEFISTKDKNKILSILRAIKATEED